MFQQVSHSLNSHTFFTGGRKRNVSVLRSQTEGSGISSFIHYTLLRTHILDGETDNRREAWSINKLHSRLKIAQRRGMREVEAGGEHRRQVEH